MEKERKCQDATGDEHPKGRPAQECVMLVIHEVTVGMVDDILSNFRLKRYNHAAAIARIAPLGYPRIRFKQGATMRCNLCDGSGMRPAPDGLHPCPECGGCGVAHCCDGLVACGEIEGDIRFERPKMQASAASARDGAAPPTPFHERAT